MTPLDEMRLLALEQTSGDGFMMFDTVRDGQGNIVDFRWTYANEQAARIVGRPSDWFPGRLLLEEMPGNREDGLFDLYVEVVQTGQPRSRSFSYRHEGLNHHFENLAVPTESGFAVRFSDQTLAQRIQQDLARNQERLTQALDAAEAIAFDWDMDRDHIRWTDGRFRLLGLEAAQLPAGLQQFEAYVHEQDRTHLTQRVQAAVRGVGRFSAEFRLRWPDGRFHWVQGQGTVSSGKDGLRMVGTIRDITSRKQQELALQYQLDLTKNITDNATTAIFMMDDRSRCTFMNPAAEAMTGYRFDELRGQILHDYIHHHYPDGRPYPMPECPIDRALPEQDSVDDHEDLFFRKNGQAFPVMCNAQVIYDEGKAIGTVIEVRDITQDKQLEASEALLERISEPLRFLQDVRSTMQQVLRQSTSDLCDWCLLDLAGDDGELQRIAGAHRNPELDGLVRSIPTRFPDAGPNASIMARVFRSGIDAFHEVFPAEVLTAMLVDPRHGAIAQTLAPTSFMAVCLTLRGRRMGVMGFARGDASRPFDATDFALAKEIARRTAIALDNANLYESLRQADQRKDTFLATLAHELRNPLAPIHNVAAILPAIKNDPARIEAVAQMIGRQATQMARLIDDLMDISRINLGKVTLQLEVCSLQPILNEAIELVQPAAVESGLALHVALPEQDLLIDADRARILQIVGNLLNNACKYSTAGGRIHLSLVQQDTQAVIRIRDSGIGMDPADVARIFQMFSQLETGRPGQSGLGIGLALSLALVRMHGGSLTAQSAGKGQGSEFTVSLPLASSRNHAGSARPDGSPESGTAQAAAAARSILVVDDNEDAALVLAFLLEQSGFEVRTAHGGRQALRAIERHKPDIVLLDLGMPGMSGYEVAANIRQNPAQEPIRLVALSGWGQQSDRDKTSRAGFDAHLVKPADILQIKALIARWFG
ncbi:MAG: PAS domain S-box protein [Burkholderiaceae bacterium]